MLLSFGMFFLCLAQEMDGAAIAIGFASSPGPTWLKDEIPIVGTHLKVHNALVQLCNTCIQVTSRVK